MKIKNLKELRKHLEKSINNALENEVFEAVKEIELKHIQSDVLDVYSPQSYERRDSLGINDPQNITHNSVKGGVLQVQNTTEFNPEYETENQGLGLAELIEYGHGINGYYYDYPTSKKFTNPRPFTDKTKKEIKDTKSHVKSMKEGLKRNKISTE